MDDRDYRRQRRDERRQLRRHGRAGNNALVGLLVIGVGGLLLLRQLGVFFPSWIFHWPMILIVVGVAIGARNNFRDLSWLILILVGVVFLADDIIPDISLRPYIWPIAVIGFGLLILTRGGRCRNHMHRNNDFTPPPPPPISPNFTGGPDTSATGAASSANAYTSQVPIDDAIDIVSVFGGVKRSVYSKTFRGGEIVTIFGGADVNLTQADFNGAIIIEVVAIFGGAKLIIPPHWTVRTEATPIFGSVEDKRPTSGITAVDKVLIIRGAVLFGGVEIKSY